jgi:uncharacterized cupredoxin-like copper-binding protein
MTAALPRRRAFGPAEPSPRLAAALLASLMLTAAGAGCSGSAVPARGSYRAQAREITVTTVPLLVRESQAVFPFLKQDFGHGGVLEGKEVYAFSPSTLVAVEGDTLLFTFVNPEDDLHTFVLPDFSIVLPGQATTRARYVAKRAGIYPIGCNVPGHAPMMSGQLVVLSPAAVAGR